MPSSTEVLRAAEAGPAAGLGSRPLGFWQRRYLLRHYREHDDVTLAAGAGMSPRAVAAFLDRMGGVRSAGDLKRIEKRGVVPPPAMFSPETARQAVTRLASRPLTALDLVLMAGLFVGSLVLYAATAARTVTGEDAGELLAAAHGFGVPHPPGYPLWLLLSWAADHLLPWGSVAWRVSLVSAIPAAAANALLLAVALKTLRHRLAAVTAAALFAVSRTHWTQAVIPEVYGLNTFFIGAQVLLLLHLAERPTAGRLVALAAVCGLSATNHTSALPLGAVFAAGAVLVAPGLLRRPRVVASALVAALLPLLLYLVLPLASAHEPYLDWGNPETSDALWQHMTRAQYAEVEAEAATTGGQAEHLRRLGILADWAGRQFGSGWVLLLAALGAGALFVRQTGAWLLLLAVGWLSSVGVTRYTAFPFEREHMYAVQIFWIPAWLALAWFLGGGLDVVLGWLARVRATARPLAFTAAAAGCFALVTLPGRAHFALADRSRTTLIEAYGQAILDAMEPGALYFPSSDHSTFAVLYVQGVLGHRPDVTVADKYGRIEPTVLGAHLQAEDRAIRERLRPADRRAFEEAALIRNWPGAVYFANRREMHDLPGRTLQPVGPLFRVMSTEEAAAWWAPPEGGGEPPGLAVWDPWLPLLEPDARQRLDFTVQMVHGDLLTMRGLALLEAGRLDEAHAAWSRLSADLAPLKQNLNNIGAALAEKRLLAEAIPYFERARAEDPRYVLALRNEAFVRKNRGERREAVDLLQQALAVKPDERPLRFELAELLDAIDEPVEALAQYEALAVADPKDPTPWLLAGHLLRRRGDRAKALDAYAEAARLDPPLPDGAPWLERLRRGQEAFDESTGWELSEADGVGMDRLFKGLASELPWPETDVRPGPGLLFDPRRGPVIPGRP